MAVGQHTRLVDGTGVSMPDTPALRAAYGRPAAQRPGCGSHVTKILALLDSATGMLRAPHTAPLGAHDLSQVPLAHPEIRPGDILIGDHAYGSFAHPAVLAGRGPHGLSGMHQSARWTSPGLAEMYSGRWQVEVDLRHLKTTLGMDVLHCQAPDGVLKELTLYAVAYDLARLVMLGAGRRRDRSPHRISLVGAPRWLAFSPQGPRRPR